MNKDKGIAESDDGSVPKEKEKEKDSKERDKGKKPLSIPAYTKEQLLTYTNAQIQTIKVLINITNRIACIDTRIDARPWCRN